MGGAYAAMTQTGAWIRSPETLIQMSEPLWWWICARGDGSLGILSVADGVTNAAAAMDVNAPEWVWRRVPIPTQSGSHRVGAVIRLDRGRADVDGLILKCGDWSGPAPGTSLEIPAVCFFHAGYTAPDFQGIVLRKDYDSNGVVFYGPKLPLEQGKYTLEMEFDTQAPGDTPLGRLNVRWRDSDDQNAIPVIAGSRAVCVFQQTNAVPFFMAFEYQRTADMTIRQVRLTRLGKNAGLAR